MAYRVSSLTKQFEQIGERNRSESVDKTRLDLSHCVSKAPDGKYSITLSRDDLNKLDGTELFKSTEFLFSWTYKGNGKNLAKFFYIVGCNPKISDRVHICVTNQFVMDEQNFPKIQTVKSLNLHILCDLSPDQQPICLLRCEFCSINRLI